MAFFATLRPLIRLLSLEQELDCAELTVSPPRRMELIES